MLNDDGVLKGWCPIGGGIEFGEAAQEALKREMHEELRCDVSITNDPIICENIFEHHGVKGHEIIFAFLLGLKIRQSMARIGSKFTNIEEVVTG